MSPQDAFTGQETPSDDDFDPEQDEWVSWLDEPHVIEACIPHLDRCFQRDPSRHDHP